MAKNKTKQIEAEAKEAIAVPETARLKFRDIGKNSTESKESESSEETAKQSHRIYYNPNNIRR